MMLTQIYWIRLDQPGALGVMPRPRGGDWLEDEIKALVRAGVTTLVSLLEPEEERELDLLKERFLAEAGVLEYLSLPIPDRGVPPDIEATVGLAEQLAKAVRAGGRVVTHCRQGIGRAALVACATLMRLGFTADDAIAVVGEARGREVPETDEQRRWLRDHAAELR